MSNVFVISDTHFGHERIIKLCNRPFSSVQEMDEKMIENWNLVVKRGDIVYHLGDFAYGKGTDPSKYFDRLNGQKFLVTGNHDHHETINLGWAARPTIYKKLRFGVDDFILFHYPIWEWDGYYHGSYHMYGHIHTEDMYKNYAMWSEKPEVIGKRYIEIGRRSMNMCVEHHNYTPQEITSLVEKMKEQGK